MTDVFTEGKIKAYVLGPLNAGVSITYHLTLTEGRGSTADPGKPEIPGPLHPSTAALLPFFDFSHLPAELQLVSRPFRELAVQVAGRSSSHGAEVTAR